MVANDRTAEASRVVNVQPSPLCVIAILLTTLRPIARVQHIVIDPQLIDWKGSQPETLALAGSTLVPCRRLHGLNDVAVIAYLALLRRL